MNRRKTPERNLLARMPVRRSRSRAGLVLLLLLSLFIARAAEAQTDRGVRVDGQVVIRVGPQGDTTAIQRAQVIEDRLARVLNQPSATQRVTVQRVPGESRSRVIHVNGFEVMQVTPQDAAANGSDVDRLARDWADRIDKAVTAAVQKRSSAWKRFSTSVRGNVSTAVAGTLEVLITIVPRLLSAAVVILFVWLLGLGVRVVVAGVTPLLVRNQSLRTLIRLLASYIVWAIGLVMALDAMGVSAQTLVTGLGLTSVALGFALKDILSNLVCGMLILAFRTFEIGDQIILTAAEGTVEQIDLRATHIRTYEGRLVIVPNSDVFTSSVTNNTASPLRRATIPVYVAYKEDLPRALAVARAAGKATPGVAGQLPTDAIIREFAPEAVVLQVTFWTDSVRGDFASTVAAARLAIVEALKNAGIRLPDPDVRQLAIDDVEAFRSALSPSAEPRDAHATRRQAS